MDPAEVRATNYGSAALSLVGLGAGILALRAVDVHLPACPFRTMTGVPCPGCGMTRLADALVHGRIGTAVAADAAGVAFLVALVAVGATWAAVAWRRRRGRAVEAPRWLRSPLLPIALGALLAIHWVTTIVTGGMTSA